LAVGSQALISPATVFKNLGLAVIDEQHRFGVNQRLALRRQNAQVDILALSATPIPRSLSLMLYGDLDSSRLTGLLPGRRPAETIIFEPDNRLAAYRRFLELVRAGGRGFVVAPRISATEAQEPARPSLNEIQRDLRLLARGEMEIGCLHSRMEAAARNKALSDFRQGSTPILVATTIIEVGVDIPAARTILIDGAECFGLAALHQLRGRVGRDGTEGHCLLLPHSLTPAAAQRLTALTQTYDGLDLAELDLQMRGPGENLGLRQSGWPALTFARLPRDLTLLPRANQLALEALAARDSEPLWENLLERLTSCAFLENADPK
jgi:ATP-dependent DNA helicase RecG